MQSLKKILCLSLTLCLIFVTSLTAHASTTIEYDDSTATVRIEDLREVTTYALALEAENAQYKKSLESERAAVANMLKAVNDERQAAQNYQAMLEEQNAALKSESDKLRRGSSRKNYIMAILGAAVITLAVTR